MANLDLYGSSSKIYKIHLCISGGPLSSTIVQIKSLFGKTFWLTVFLIIVSAGISEWIARTETFHAIFTPPIMGSRHYQLGHKLSLLNAAIKENGPIDCIMVGSSVVDVGFDPLSFQNSYQGATGRNIHCFNFGIDASSATSTAALAQILIEDYQPRLLIFGTDPRDYALPREDRDPQVILETSWVRYRLEDFSLDGWLIEHSYFYRYRQQLSDFARLNFEGTLRSSTKMKFEILPNGFTPFSQVSTYINEPPKPGDDSFEVTYYSRIYSPYHIYSENLAALERMMGDRETQVIVVEMPVSDGLYYFFDDGEKDYNRYISNISELAHRQHVPFWRTEPLDFIPDIGWMDYSHLNMTGAEIFSTWLGQQIGNAENQGSIVSPSANPTTKR